MKVENGMCKETKLDIKLPLTMDFIIDFGIHIFHQILTVESNVDNPIFNMNIDYKDTCSFGMSLGTPYDDIKERIMLGSSSINDFWIEIRTFKKATNPFCIIEATKDSLKVISYDTTILYEDKIQEIIYGCLVFCSSKSISEISIKLHNGKHAAKQKWHNDVEASREHKWNKVQLFVNSVIALLAAALGYFLGQIT